MPSIKNINLPSWFKYNFDDFINKNKEVWRYIINIKEFSKIMELYSFCAVSHDIKQSLEETISENFKNYNTDDINLYFEESNKFKLNSFNKDIRDFLNYCEKRNRLPEVIKQDLENLEKLKSLLGNVSKLSKEIGCEKYFGCSREIKDIEEAEKNSEVWAREKQIVGDGSDDDINRLMKLLPKTFDYVSKNKLGWYLGGWSGGY